MVFCCCCGGGGGSLFACLFVFCLFGCLLVLNNKEKMADIDKASLRFECESNLGQFDSW